MKPNFVPVNRLLLSFSLFRFPLQKICFVLNLRSFLCFLACFRCISQIIYALTHFLLLYFLLVSWKSTIFAVQFNQLPINLITTTSWQS